MTSETPFQIDANAVTWRREHQTLHLAAWRSDGVRLRATLLSEIQDLPGALLAGCQSAVGAHSRLLAQGQSVYLQV